VTFEMVNADEREVSAPCQRLPVHHADEERPHQARCRCDSDAVQAADPHAGVIQCAVHHRRDGLHMCPARELGHDTAEDGVHVLREDHQALQRGDASVKRHHGG
jgi:hypothetical protein